MRVRKFKLGVDNMEKKGNKLFMNIYCIVYSIRVMQQYVAMKVTKIIS